MGINIIIAQTLEQRKQCYKIRYDVFMKETGYIQEKNGKSSESDGYDELDTTFHLLAYFNGEPAGTVRLLFPNAETAKRDGTYFGLSMEDVFDIKYYTTSNLRIAEISRSCVKNQFKSTRTIFYLWRNLIDFAVSRGITDLVTSVNPETDKLCDAYLLYDHIKANKLMDENITVNPKKPGIGKIKGFRFPLTRNSCCYESDGGEGIDIKMPQTLRLFTKVGSLFTGEPVYCEKIDMCALPMNWDISAIGKTQFGKFFIKEDVHRDRVQTVKPHYI